MSRTSFYPVQSLIFILVLSGLIFNPAVAGHDSSNDSAPHVICVTCGPPGGGGGGSGDGGGDDSGGRDDVFSGAFLYFVRSKATIEPAQMPDVLDQLQSMGVDTVVISHTRYVGGGSCATSASDIHWTDPFDPALKDGLEVLLSAADERNMRVYVGLIVSMTNCGANKGGFWNGSNADIVVQDTATTTAYIYQNYGSHKSLAGWYVPDEPGDLPAEKYDYYRRLANVIKINGGYLPVAVAPFFGGGYPGSPGSLADAATSFANYTGIDVQIWQDSIGTRANPKLYPWERDAYRTAQYYKALSNALGRDGLWADIELHNSSWSNARLRTLPAIVFTPASLYRVNKQLYAAHFAGKRLLWVPQVNAATQWDQDTRLEDERAETAGRLYHSILALYRDQGSVWNPTAYYYSKRPSSRYPDDGNEKLFDHQPGDPENLHDPTWVGIYGDETLTVKLKAKRHVDWVGVELLTKPSWNIVAPMEMTISCSENNADYHQVANVSAPSSVADIDLSDVGYYEYVLSNRHPLDADNCKFIRIYIPNNKWTFISEIEITSDY